MTHTALAVDPLKLIFQKRIYGNAYCKTDTEFGSSTTKNMISLLARCLKPPNLVG